MKQKITFFEKILQCFGCFLSKTVLFKDWFPLFGSLVLSPFLFLYRNKGTGFGAVIPIKSGPVSRSVIFIKRQY